MRARTFAEYAAAGYLDNLDYNATCAPDWSTFNYSSDEFSVENSVVRLGDKVYDR